MHLLAAEFMGKGEVARVSFKRLFRHNDICLYCRSDGCFEIIRVRFQKSRTVLKEGKLISYLEKEYYPKGEDWGKFEFCVTDRVRAIARFNALANSLNYKIVLTESDLP